MEGVITGSRMRPPRMVIHGAPKVGKTTFAAQAPDAIFIQTEEGADEVGVSRFPLAQTLDDVGRSVKRLLEEDHDFKTVVIDSVDWLESLIHARVAAEAGVPNIDGIGYGKGYAAAAEILRKILGTLDQLRDKKGMAIVLIAHSEIKRFDSPDVEPYDRWTLKMHRSATAILTEWCDLIGFCSQEMWIEETDVGFQKKARRGKTGDKRVIHLTDAPAHLAGNRYGLAKKCDLEWEALMRAFAKASAKKISSSEKQQDEQQSA